MYYDMKSSGKRIQQLRNAQKMTQEQLADKVRISHSMMAKIERGAKGASIDLLIEIAEYFKVSLDYIILGRETHTDYLKQRIHEMLNELLEIEKQL